MIRSVRLVCAECGSEFVPEGLYAPNAAVSLCRKAAFCIIRTITLTIP